MVLPALASYGSRLVGPLLSGGLFAAGTKSAKNLIPKAKNAISKFLGNSTGKNAAFAIGGFSTAELFDALGIQNKQFQNLTLVALVIGIVITIGQIFNVDLNL